MKPEDLMDMLYEKYGYEYGIYPPPVTDKEFVDIIIKHFLGEDWYTCLPCGREQCNTEALYEILYKNQSLKEKIKRIFKK